MKILYTSPGVGFYDGRYLKLDASNDPVTGDLLLTPTADSTTVLQVTKADTTVVLNVDTTNARVGVNNVAPTHPVTIDTVGQHGLRINSNSNSYGLELNKSGVAAVLRPTVMGGTSNNTFSIQSNGQGEIYITNSRRVGIGGDGAAAKLHVMGTADDEQLIVQANATQTANISENQLSDTTVVSGFDERGILFSDGGSGVTNVYLGDDAGNIAVSPTGNTGIGYRALSNVTGSSNTAIGNLAGGSLTSGVANMFLGNAAGGKTTEGSNNTAIGSSALADNVTQDGNVCVGQAAGKDMTGGLSNVFVGVSSGENNIGGDRNVYIGDNAGRDNTSSTSVMIGWLAGQQTTSATQNTFVGAVSGQQSSTADRCIHLGYYSGALNVTSDRLIVDNQYRASAGLNVTNPILYGVMAATPASQTLRINANLGVGITPTANMDGIALEGGLLTFKETTAPTADTNYGKIWTNTSNELWFQDGAGASHLLHGDAFSNIWFHSPNTVAVSISTEDAFTQIDSFTVVGNEDDAGNVVGSSSTNDLTLSAVAGGEYEISYHGSVTATGGADKDMMVALGITLATPKDITDVTDNTITPIVITSISHGFKEGDMVEIVGVLGNTAANGSFVVDNETANTFEITSLDGSATTGNGDFDEGSPTGDVTIEYPGNMVVHRAVRGADPGAISATGLHVLADSDVLALYVANLVGTTNLTVLAVSLDAARIGD